MLSKACRAAFLVLCLAGCEGRIGDDRLSLPPEASSGTSTHRVSFVHMTDPHLFDAGSARHGEGVEEEALDNRAALHWAVLETNRLVLAERQAVDFVVITGDFGLDNVTMPKMEGVAHDKCECPQRSAGKEGPIVAIPLQEAAAEVARALRALVVKRVFLVPGNNDLCHESPRDLHRWAEFVHAVRGAMKGQSDARGKALQANHASDAARALAPRVPDVVDLTYSLERLYADKSPRIRALVGNAPGPVPAEPPAINGVFLVGLNSAYFKAHADAALQTASDAESLREMAFVRQRIRPGGSYLIFTHILDLPDPHRAAGTGRGTEASVWRLPVEARKLWRDEILARSEVLGVFGGHFHASERDLYPHNFGYAKPDAIVAEKTWLAPPLAAKYQSRTPAAKVARGMLLATVTTSGGVRVAPPGGDHVTSLPMWFSTLDQVAAVKDDEKLALARAEARDGNWEEAAKRYAEALGSADSRTRASAAQGYARARAVTGAWWWEVGRYVPPLRWAFIHPVRVLLFLPAVVVICGGLLLIFGALRRLRYLYVGWAIKRVLMPRYLGRARLNPSVALTTGAPADVFAAQMLAAGEEIRERLKREQESWMAGQASLLVPPFASMASLLASVPNVARVDVSAWLRFFLQLGSALRWNVDSGIAVFHLDGAPSATPAAGTSSLPERGSLSAYAVLQWAWMSKNSWRRTVTYRDHRGHSTMADLARRMSALILGEAFV